jgi:hypothetical protein
MAAPDAGGRMKEAEAALYAALRARGHEVEAGTAVVSGERINFRFEEVLREVQAPLTAQERRSVGKGSPATKRVLMPTGKPVLIAKPADRHGGGERRWTDKGRRLKTITRKFTHIFQRVDRPRLLHMPYTYAGDGKEAVCPRATRLWMVMHTSIGVKTAGIGSAPPT